jgi:hypothetical protein
MRDVLSALGVTLFGLGLLLVGGRLVAYHHLLATGGQDVLAEITDVGSVRNSTGGYVDYVRYRFTDHGGTVRRGRASGYSGRVGETLRVRYAPGFPAVHRVSGSGGRLDVRVRWAILAAGAVFLFGGVRWLATLRASRA